MTYEFILSQSTFCEPHTLLVHENGSTVLINLLIQNNNIHVYDEQGQRFIKTLPLEHFDESCLDSNKTNFQSRDLILKFGPGDDLYLKTKHFEQKERITVNIARAYKEIENKLIPAKQEKKLVPVKAIRGTKPAPSSVPAWHPPRSSNETKVCPDQTGDAVPDPNPSVLPVEVLVPCLIPAEQVMTSDGTVLIMDPPVPILQPTEHIIGPKQAEGVVPNVGYEQPETSNNPEEYVWLIEEPVDRKIVESMLTDKSNGYYYVRARKDADADLYPYALSVKYNDKVVHIQIQRIPDGRLVLAPWSKGEDAFHTVYSLVEYYERNRFTFVQDGKNGSMSLNTV